MRICICTTPIRPTPTYYPPFGSIAIIQALRKIGEAPTFYHIDYHRPSHAEIMEYFSHQQFDLVGISAVVSTAYAYTKDLATTIKKASPHSEIVVGGNLAASAEILLRKCSIDYCVAGDGEIVIQELVGVLRDHGRDLARLRHTKGICFIDDRNEFTFTGYGQRLAAGDLEDPDYSILEESGCLDHYMRESSLAPYAGIDSPTLRRGRTATVTVSKGCVARCTFCHRWEKGYRALPVEKLRRHLCYLKDTYHITNVSIAAENFASDKRQAEDFATLMGTLDLQWGAGGVRTSSVSPDQLAHWKANNCRYVTFGIESGSQTILDVMEKRTTVAQNYNALKWTYEAGLISVIQLIVGMPGETDETVRETIEFLKGVSGFLYIGEKYPSSMISLNYAQALPGTPLYEYAREHGFIGSDLDAEEAYLLRISDTDAYRDDHFVNYTGLPLLKVLMWQQQVLAEVDADYARRRVGLRFSLPALLRYYYDFAVARWSGRTSTKGSGVNRSGRGKTGASASASDNGYFNIRDASKFTPLLLNDLTRPLFPGLLAIGVAFGRRRAQSGMRLLLGYLWWSVKRSIGVGRTPDLPKVSLRKVVTIRPATTDPAGDQMIPLRLGR